jgi:acylphosphatase
VKIRATVTISGLVQGVSFRYHTFEKAGQYSILGWVKNLPNGDVLGCFEGEQDAVMALIGWCRMGPRHARVDAVTVERLTFTGEFSSFQIRS